MLARLAQCSALPTDREQRRAEMTVVCLRDDHRRHAPARVFVALWTRVTDLQAGA